MSEPFTGAIVLLNCGHTVAFTIHAPKMGEEIWCIRCREYSTVAHRNGEYRMRCTQCNYARRTGVARFAAETYAITHSRRTAHKVDVYLGDTLFSEFHFGGSTLALEGSDGPSY